MKRMLSLLVVLAMVFAMVPTTYAANTDIDFDDLIGATKVITDISNIEVDLKNGSDGTSYSWTPEEDGVVTFQISGSEGAEIVVTLTQGENTATSENGTVSLDVTAGTEVIIEVSEANSAAATATLSGSQETPLGGKNNPIIIYPEWVWNEKNTEATATLADVPVGTTYYAAYRIGGMFLSVDGGEGVMMDNNGMMAPSTFAVTNDTEAVKEVTLKIAYPEGSQMNPEVIESMQWYSDDVVLEEGDYDGYYYSYTAEATGSITLYISSITEGVEGDIVLYNLNTYEQKTLVLDGVDNFGLEVTMDVTEGDVINIQVMTQAVEYVNPAAELSWAGSFAYPVGSEQNPIYPEFVWNEENTEATATVTAPVGTTYYAVYGGGGMLLTINDGEPIELVAAGMGRAPAIFTITNDGEAAAEYSLKIAYPVGSQMNPEVLEELGWIDVALEAADNDGYYYTYTAPADGTVTVYIGSITEGVTGDIVVTNMRTYAQKSLTGDGVDNFGLELTVEVAEGDELIIQVMATSGADWSIPAAEIAWVGNFTYPEGTEQNPVQPEWEWNEEYTEATATVTVPAGETIYFAGINGMQVSINGGEPTLMEGSGFGPYATPALIVITNEGEEAAEYTLEISYPVGAAANPAELVIGENTAAVPGNGQPYFYTWTAEEDCNLVITMTGNNWTYVVNNLTSNAYGDNHASNDNPVVATETIAVKAGDEIQIAVGTADYTAAEVSFTAEITKGIPGDMNDDGEVNDTDALYLLRHTLFADRYPITKDGDVDGNGGVNDADALYLLRYTLFPDRYPLYPKAE